MINLIEVSRLSVTVMSDKIDRKCASGRESQIEKKVGVSGRRRCRRVSEGKVIVCALWSTLCVV